MPLFLMPQKAYFLVVTCKQALKQQYYLLSTSLQQRNFSLGKQICWNASLACVQESLPQPYKKNYTRLLDEND